jgi:DNA-binding transcriptional LysR family regulator
MNQLEEMQIFVRIVDAGSITKVAEQMSTVKSAISRRLSELESRLGVSLLTRTTRTHSITDAGLAFYDHCVRIIDEVSQAESSISNKEKALEGRIRLAVPLSFGLAKLSPLLQQFNDLHPKIQFDVDFNDRHIELAEEGFDLAIRIAKLKDSSLIAKRLTSIQLILCASPAYLAKHGIPNTPQDLANGHVKLDYYTAPDSWKFSTKSGGTESISIPSVMNANNGDFLCQAAIAGKGVILMPDFICAEAVESEQLNTILPNQLTHSLINVYAVYPQNKHQPQRVKSLISFLVEQFKANNTAR